MRTKHNFKNVDISSELGDEVLNLDEHISDEQLDIMHKKKMFEICEGYSEEDVRTVCTIFARKYPSIMHQSLMEEHTNMCALLAGMRDLNSQYIEKINK